MTPALDHVSVDLWPVALEVVTPDLESWLARLDAQMQDAASRGVALVMLPEFTCAQWLAFAPPDLAPAAQLDWLAGIGEIALPRMQQICAQHAVSLLAGTIPARIDAQDAEQGTANRAYLLTPGGEIHWQDKLSLTPLEANGASGTTVAGDEIRVIRWNGLRVAIAVCLDTEYTALWSILGTLDLDLVLIPAKTDMITGFNRVFACARARAIELQTAVCAVGAVGAPLVPPAADSGVGGAGVFLPCDVSVSLDGVHAWMAPEAGGVVSDVALQAVAIPVGACRAIRNGAAEAELRPALWSGEHLRVVETAE